MNFNTCPFLFHLIIMITSLAMVCYFLRVFFTISFREQNYVFNLIVKRNKKIIFQGIQNKICSKKNFKRWITVNHKHNFNI